MMDYQIADISLADWGRKEIAIAEVEMPGLVALREEYLGKYPLKGARITGCLHMSIQPRLLMPVFLFLPIREKPSKNTGPLLTRPLTGLMVSHPT